MGKQVRVTSEGISSGSKKGLYIKAPTAAKWKPDDYRVFVAAIESSDARGSGGAGNESGS